MIPFRVLLVHNHVSGHPVTWLSFLIRVVTCSKWNHVALEFTYQGQRQVVESIGKGVICTPWEEWFTHARRIVKPMSRAGLEVAADVLLGDLVGQPYGFLDLMQLFLHLVRTRWLGSSRSWNGRDGVFGRPGLFCSELVALLLGYPAPHLVTPGDLEHCRDLVPGAEFTTGPGENLTGGPQF
jgi:hypothetical protein